MPSQSAKERGYEHVCELCLDIVQMGSEEEIVDALVGVPKALGFQDSRYYDANRCPFRKCHFYVLRASNRAYDNAEIGYPIYDPTLTDEAAAGRDPVWGAAPQRSREGDPVWIQDLELRGHEWIDVPVFAGGHVLGLWALNRPKEKNVTSRQAITPVLKRLASVAGLKIHELRQARIASLSSETFAYSIELSHSPRRDMNKQRAELLTFCLDRTCRALNAATLAYFEFDPFVDELRKTAEVRFDGKETVIVSDRKADRQYQRGQCLTGTAWDDEVLRHIPDFSEMQRQQPHLVDQDSLSLHERVLEQDIRTVIYERLQVPGALPGFLRAINRVDEPALTFTGEHCDLLHRIASPFAQVLGTIQASARQATVAGAFAETVKALQDESFTYKPLGKASAALGFPVVLVTIWAVDQTLAEAWSNKAEFEKAMKPCIGALLEGAFSDYKLDGQVPVSKLPEPISSVLDGCGVSECYAVFLPPPDPEREESETSLVLFPLVFAKRSWQGTTSVTDARQFWRQQPNLLTAATILGQLAGTMRELARNRDMLYSAEQAVGYIGHEMRSPVASLGQISEQICEQEFRLLDAVNKDGELRTTALVTRGGKPELATLIGYTKVCSWLMERSARIADYVEIGQRVVSDAIWWARMGGQKVEMDLKRVRLSRTLDMCIDELSKEIRERSPLRIEVKGGVQRTPPFVADPVLLHTLVFNLLDNAIKYTHSRGDRDTVVTVTAEHQTNLVDLHITNWGLGIDRTDYTNIFSSFYRSKFRDRLHTVRGVGLGLATCRRIVRLHGGRIWVRSLPTLDDPERTAAMEGFETTFSVRLPTTLEPGRIDKETDRYQMKKERE